MSWEVTAAALVVVTWPVVQFGVMIATILLPGIAWDRIDHASGRTAGMTSAERARRWRERQGLARQSVNEHAPWYPEEPREPHRRCSWCGHFLRWDDYYGRWDDHLSYDGETWEATCQ